MNPPAPGWKPPVFDCPSEDVDCEIVEVVENDIFYDGRMDVSRLRTPDGREFDPRIDPAMCVPLAPLP